MISFRVLSAASSVDPPVRRTMATASSSPLPPGDVLRIRMILVPLYRTCFDKSALISPPGAETRPTTPDSIGTLETGTDSPVSIDSLTIASPERRTTSAGKVCKFSYARSIKSPGTSEAESSMIPARVCSGSGLGIFFRRLDARSHSESRYTRTGHENRDISRIRSTFCGACKVSFCSHSFFPRVSELTARVSSRVEMMETTEMTAIAKA